MSLNGKEVRIDSMSSMSGFGTFKESTNISFDHSSWELEGYFKISAVDAPL